MKTSPHLTSPLPPVERIASLYAAFPGGRTFSEDLEAHLQNGYLISTPEFFLMGRAVDRFADPTLIRDPFHSFSEAQINSWFVFAFAGSSRNFLKFLPFSLRWVGWERAKSRTLRFHDFNRFATRCESLTRS